MTDQLILTKIKEGDLEQPIKKLYEHFPAIRLTLLKYGAKDEYIQEIFNDSLVLLIEKVNQPNFQLTAQFKTLLTGYSLNIWRNQHRSLTIRQKRELESVLETDFQLLEFDESREQQLSIVDSILDQLQEKCKQILQLFYYQKKSMKEIARTLSFSSEQSAKTQKYKCIEKAQRLASESFNHHQNEVV